MILTFSEIIIFPSSISKWNKLDRDIRNSYSLNIFKLSLLKFVRRLAYNVFDINNPYALKFLTRLRLGLSQLRYSKFRRNFQNSINSVCGFDLEIETKTHFLLHYSTTPSFNMLDNPS